MNMCKDGLVEELVGSRMGQRGNKDKLVKGWVAVIP